MFNLLSLQENTCFSPLAFFGVLQRLRYLCIDDLNRGAGLFLFLGSSGVWGVYKNENQFKLLGLTLIGFFP